MVMAVGSKVGWTPLSFDKGTTEGATNPTSPSHLEVIAKLRSMIDTALGPIVPRLIGTRFSLLDFPDHGNVGDSAIWMGEMDWLRRTIGCEPAYANDHRTEVGTMQREIPPGPILLHGGGNFGDLWPEIQRSREATLLALRQRPIIQLPQSIHFGSSERLDTAARAVAATRDFTLLVRDQESLLLAERHFDCQVALCPDLAFAIGPLQRLVPPTRDVLVLLRTDLESKGFTHFVPTWPDGWHFADWLEDGPGLHTGAIWNARWHALASLDVRRWGRASRRLFYYRCLAQARLARGLRLLAQARFIITDRLHVHILSTLMGIPHCVLDNSYGKIRRFSDAFGTRWAGVKTASSLPDAIEIARTNVEPLGEG